MQQNFLEICFYLEDTQVAQEVHQRGPVGPTRHQGAPWWVVGPTGTPSTASQLYKYSNIPETLGESRDKSFHNHKFQNHEIQSRALFRHLVGGGNDHDVGERCRK